LNTYKVTIGIGLTLKECSSSYSSFLVKKCSIKQEKGLQNVPLSKRKDFSLVQAETELENSLGEVFNMQNKIDDQYSFAGIYS
jgi:hypothetical protein